MNTMKNLVKNLVIISLILSAIMAYALSAVAQSTGLKEVLLIGTMHEVPKIVKHSYHPLLKRAKAYQPEAIYVESPPAWDTLSLKNSRSKFLALADSLKRCPAPDAQRLAAVQCKALGEMTTEDFQLLQLHYYQQLDAANAEYYGYLAAYGTAGSPTPTREEDGDLTARLAIYLGLKEVRSMDNQWYREAYHKAWAACSRADRQDGEIKNLKKIMRSFILPETWSGLSGRLGLYTNSQKTTQKYHILNSFQYRDTTCEPCTEGKNYWDARNLEMARNIGNQIRENTQQRSVVIVGAGHIVGLHEALQANYPDIEVKLLR